MDDKMQRELMSKLAELESKHKRRLPPDDIHLRLRRDMDRAQKDTPVISKELFILDELIRSVEFKRN